MTHWLYSVMGATSPASIPEQEQWSGDDPGQQRYEATSVCTYCGAINDEDCRPACDCPTCREQDDDYRRARIE